MTGPQGQVAGQGRLLPAVAFVLASEVYGTFDWFGGVVINRRLHIYPQPQIALQF